MKKTIPILFCSIFCLTGCNRFPEPPTAEQSSPELLAEYELTNLPVGTSPSNLRFYDDQSFTLDFNLCHFMATGAGTYQLQNDTYLLNVESCLDCDGNEYNQSQGEDYGLSTVNLELQKIGANELKIQNEVMRTEAGEQVGFCAPTSDPQNLRDGENYDTFKLSKGAPLL